MATYGHEGGGALNEHQRGGHDPSPPLGEWHPEKPSVSQILEAAPKLHWRKCFECKHIGLHVDNVTPWVNCRKCSSQDTRQMKGIVIVG